MKLQKERKNRINIMIGLLAGTSVAYISKILEWWEYGIDGKGTLKIS